SPRPRTRPASSTTSPRTRPPRPLRRRRAPRTRRSPRTDPLPRRTDGRAHRRRWARPSSCSLQWSIVSDDTWLVVGLGNPGPRYAGNRHNVGAMVVGELAGRTGTRLRAHKAGASAESARLGPPPGHRAVLGVPHSYMNVSGGPVKALASFFSVPVERLVV